MTLDYQNLRESLRMTFFPYECVFTWHSHPKIMRLVCDFILFRVISDGAPCSCFAAPDIAGVPRDYARDLFCNSYTLSIGNSLIKHTLIIRNW